MLIDGRWSRKYERCRFCHSTSAKHHARGICVNCMSQIYYRDHPEYAERQNRRRRRAYWAAQGYEIRDRLPPVDGWSRNAAFCQGCGTDQVPHKAGGWCCRCYPIRKKLEKLSRLDLSLFREGLRVSALQSVKKRGRPPKYPYKFKD